MCFVAVAFWNMIGAGVFGFLINPPISLFYIQGLNTTAVHAHAALFGVYGFLALGFVLLVARYLKPNAQFDDKLMTWAFWLLNGGLVGMIAISLLPVGVFKLTLLSLTVCGMHVAKNSCKWKFWIPCVGFVPLLT